MNLRDLISSTTLTGLVVVFVVLIVLIAAIKVFGIVINAMQNKKRDPLLSASSQPQKADSKGNAILPAVTSDVSADSMSDEILAVITAAIAFISDNTSSQKYVVRNIRRAENGRPIWGFAGISENTRPF